MGADAWTNVCRINSHIQLEAYIYKWVNKGKQNIPRVKMVFPKGSTYNILQLTARAQYVHLKFNEQEFIPRI